MSVPDDVGSKPRLCRGSIVCVILGVIACVLALLLALPQTQTVLLTRAPAISFNVAQAIVSVLGVIVGIRALFEIRRRKPGLSGKGLAVVGILVNLGATLVLLPVVMIGSVLPTLAAAAAQQTSMSNLHEIALALHKYHDELGRLPPAAVCSYDGEPLYSWRVLLLPFLGHDELFQKFRLDEPWDSPTNKPLLAEMPQIYAPPGERFPPADFATSYLVFDGPDAIFFSGSKPAWFDDELNRGRTPSFQVQPQRPGERPVYAFGYRSSVAAIMDGTMNTIMLVEADLRVPWSKPQELNYAADQPLSELGGRRQGSILVALADGSVRIVRKTADEAAIRAAITANGGEIPPPDWLEP